MHRKNDPKILDEKSVRLFRLRCIALAVLLALMLVYGGSFFILTDPFWRAFVRDVAEAGMIGGLADWFAVEALFRRPLGLPIPHTGLLPKNQRRVAKNVGRFVEEYLMEPSRIGMKIRQEQATSRLTEWVLSEGVASKIAKFLSRRLSTVAKMQPSEQLITQLSELVRKALQSPAAGQSIARSVADIIRGPASDALLDRILELLRGAIESNRDSAARLVSENSRWWTPKVVDRYMAGMIVEGGILAIDEMQKPDSALRDEFVQAVQRLAENIEIKGGENRAIQSGLHRLGDSEAVRSLVESILNALQKELETAVETGQIAQRIETELRIFAYELKQNPHRMKRIDRRAAVILTSIAIDARPMVRQFVQDTLSEWDSKLLIDRVEKEVGSDLQFIRINGAVLGALLGAVFFGLSHAF